MENSGFFNGFSANNQEIQADESDILTAEWLETPIEVSMNPEYKGGGDPETQKETSQEEVTIEFGDGIRINLNRRNLAAESHFFRALFLNNFVDSHSSILKLPTIPSDIFRKCLSLSYSAAQTNPSEPIQLPLQMAVDLMPVASYLCMDALLEVLSDAIHTKVETSSILPAFRMATYRHPPLAYRLWKTLIRRFRTLVVNGEHLQLTEDEFMEAFADENLNIPSRMEASVVKEYIRNYPDDARLYELSENLNFTGDGLDSFGVCRNRIPNEVVLTLGGWCSMGPSDVIETYNIRNQKWIASSRIKGDFPRAYHTLNVLNNNSFLVCGGMDGREHFRKTSIFDIRTKEWNQLSEMRERRCYITGALIPNSTHKKLVMVVGGYNGMERLNTCELFDYDENAWQTLPNMEKSRSDYGLVAIGSQLAVVGGFDGRQMHSDVEMYDPHNNQWYPVTRRMKSRRTGVCAVALDSNVLLAVGGFNGSQRLKTAEMLDMREGTWHQLPQMHTTRSNFGIEFMDGMVYAVGGYDGTSTTAETERFDLSAQKWERMAPLLGSKSALKMIRLTDSDFIRTLIEFDEEVHQ